MNCVVCHVTFCRSGPGAASLQVSALPSLLVSNTHIAFDPTKCEVKMGQVQQGRQAGRLGESRQGDRVWAERQGLGRQAGSRHGGRVWEDRQGLGRQAFRLGQVRQAGRLGLPWQAGRVVG